MFADDTKVWSRIKNESDTAGLQDDLNSLCKWSGQWLLKFNVEKCKVMHIGHKQQSSYNLRSGNLIQDLKSTKEERDLGVLVTDDLKSSRQCAAAVAKANSILGLIRRNFRCLDKYGFLLLYKAYIRPHLEYCIQAWNPHLVKDIQQLEGVQRRATQLVAGFRMKSYKERLRLIGLTTLERRRERGDLIEAFKIITGREKVDREEFFRLAEDRYNMRGHSMRLFKPRVRTTQRQHAFSVRVVDSWNRLPKEVIEATSVNDFKNRLDTHWSADMNN